MPLGIEIRGGMALGPRLRPLTTSHLSGCPVIMSMTRSSLATLPVRMALKKNFAPGVVAVTS